MTAAAFILKRFITSEPYPAIWEDFEEAMGWDKIKEK